MAAPARKPDFFERLQSGAHSIHWTRLPNQ